MNFIDNSCQPFTYYQKLLVWLELDLAINSGRAACDHMQAFTCVRIHGRCVCVAGVTAGSPEAVEGV
jgi:hypothetical protein